MLLGEKEKRGSLISIQKRTLVFLAEIVSHLRISGRKMKWEESV